MVSGNGEMRCTGPLAMSTVVWHVVGLRLEPVQRLAARALQHRRTGGGKGAIQRGGGVCHGLCQLGLELARWCHSGKA